MIKELRGFPRELEMICEPIKTSQETQNTQFLYWFNPKVLMIPPSVYIQSSLTMETTFDTMTYEVCQAQLHGQTNHKSRTKQNSMSNSLAHWLDINSGI